MIAGIPHLLSRSGAEKLRKRAYEVLSGRVLSEGARVRSRRPRFWGGLESRCSELLKDTLLRLCVLAGPFMSQREGAIILFYHSIDDSGSPLSLSPGMFKRQMDYLRENKCHCCSLVDIVAYIRGEKKLPAKSFCVSFDDGYLNNHKSLLYLVEQGFPFTIFISTGTVGTDSQEIITKVPGGLGAILSWEQLTDLCATGLVNIESHGHTHRNLDGLPRVEMEEELNLARDKISKHLGQESKYLAYPRGAYSQSVIEASRKIGYEAAFGIEPGWVRPGDDLWSVKRIGINDRVTWLQFRSLFTQGYELYLLFRKLQMSVLGGGLTEGDSMLSQKT